MDLTLQALKTFGALAVVLTVLFGAAWALKRWGHRFTRGSDQSRIHLLERRYLGPKHSLLLVRVAGETLLLGLSPQGLSFLTSVDTAAGAPVELSGSQDEQP